MSIRSTKKLKKHKREKRKPEKNELGEEGIYMMKKTFYKKFEKKILIDCDSK